MTTVYFKRTFSAAHRIWNDDSHCQRIHGHNYRANVTIDAERPLLAYPDEAPPVLNEQGFVVPWADVKAIIDQLDHKLILDQDDPLVAAVPDDILEQALPGLFAIDGPPSTERLARWLAEEIARLVRQRYNYKIDGSVCVHLHETDALSASHMERL